MTSNDDPPGDDVYAPLCHPRSRVGNLDTSLGGSEWPVCFSCFLDDLAAFDCRGYTTLADLVESGDRWDAPGIHLTVWMADPFVCECPTCGAHGKVHPGVLEICGDRLVCRPCVADGHDAPIGIAPHTGMTWPSSRQSGGPAPSYDKAAIAAALAPLERWHQLCHGASLHLVNSGVVPGSRVARGTCKGVGGQHSWVVVGHDVYARNAIIIDPTLWSYDPSIKGIWYGGAADKRHTPFGGAGSIWAWGKPSSHGGAPVHLTPKVPLSGEAARFLEMIGPLDDQGWATLCHAPVLGWPAAEIIAAIADTKGLAHVVPVDILGMLTDRNPGGLYLPKRHKKMPGGTAAK